MRAKEDIMSWLTKRAQTARLRGRHRTKRAKKLLLRLRLRAVMVVTPRFLSGARLLHSR
jgi:hypothetical protein